ncbi:MAG: hypothetical protein HYY06_06695 [Deltaproteobacteria bacterium]|nr:hypothetical protein [Deltaproteobacteria bacterium]
MRLRLLWVCSLTCVACSEERAALDDFLNLGAREARSEGPLADPTALGGVRARRFDFADPDRVRIEAELEAPIATPPEATLPRAEAAARALLADGQAAAVRVLVVPEGLPIQLGAIAVAVMARDGKGWTGAEVVWRQTAVLAATGPPPSNAEVQLAAAVARSEGAMDRRFASVAEASSVSAQEVRRSYETVTGYLGDPP